MKLILIKEWMLAIRQLGDVLQPIFFLFILITIFPIALGTNQELLIKVAPAIIWVAILLAILLSSDKLYRADFEDGSLEQLYLSGNNQIITVYLKLIIQFLTLITPIILALPIMAVFYQLNFTTISTIAITILVGAPSLILFAMFGASLTLSISRGGLLLILLILPFYIPILIFAISAIREQQNGFSFIGQIYILIAFLALSLTILPFAINATNKASIGE